MDLNFNTATKWVRLAEGATPIDCNLKGLNIICKGRINIGGKLRLIESEQGGMAINRNFLCVKCWQTYGEKVLESHKKIAKQMLQQKGMGEMFNKQVEKEEDSDV